MKQYWGICKQEKVFKSNVRTKNFSFNNNFLSKNVFENLGPQTWADRYLQLSAPGHRQSPVINKTNK